jgi:hypothetical protein
MVARNPYTWNKNQKASIPNSAEAERRREENGLLLKKQEARQVILLHLKGPNLSAEKWYAGL